MQLVNQPNKLILPFAEAGGKRAIPVDSQIGITAGAASLTDGFPPLTRTNKKAGGIPPSGLDMNGILYMLSAIDRWNNAGAGYTYDATFATDADVNGYPKGARVLRSDGEGYWLNVADNNTTNPESGGTDWVPEFVAGVATIALTNANVTLSPLQFGRPIIILTGTLSANVNVIVPALQKTWCVINNTTASFSVTIKTASGAGTVVTQGSTEFVVGDGTNVLGTTQAASYIVAAGGTADALTATFNPALTAYANGLPMFVRAGAANATTTPTVNVNGLGAKTIVKGNNLPLVAGDIAGAGHWLELQYDTVLDKVVLQNPANGAISAIGVGQNWQNVTGSRAFGTTYTNTTGKPILILITAGGNNYTVQINGVTVRTVSGYGGVGGMPYSSETLIPAGATYSVTNGGSILSSWFELR